MGESKRRRRELLPDESAIVFNEKTREFRLVMAHDRQDLVHMLPGTAFLAAVAIKMQKEPDWTEDLIKTYLKKRDDAVEDAPATEPVEHKMSAGDVSNGALLTGLNARPQLDPVAMSAGTRDFDPTEQPRLANEAPRRYALGRHPEMHNLAASSPLVQAALAAGAQLIPAVPSRDEILFAPYGRPEDQLTPEQAADPYGYIAREKMPGDPEWDRLMAEGIKKLAQAKAEGKKVTFITSYTDLPDGTVELTVADQDRPASPYRVIVSRAEARRVLKDYPLEPGDVETPS